MEIDPIYASQTDLEPSEFLVNMGPQHPSTHGVLRLLIRIDGEVIKECIPDLGFLHRTFEKIAENRTYPQVIPYTDRMDYLGAMNANLGFAMAVEKLAGYEVPDRGQWMRMLVCELNRIGSHLIWLGTFGLDIGAITPFLHCFRERELILDMFEIVAGNRLTYNYIRVGGVANDSTPEFMRKLDDFISIFPDRLKDYSDLLVENVIFQQRCIGVGAITQEQAIQYGITGPMLRSTGLEWDLRKTEPYMFYDKLDFKVPTRTDGDCMGRCYLRVAEMWESLHLVKQIREMMTEGPIMGKVPRFIKPPVGEVYSRTESPRGEYGVYLVSDGTTKPYRVKYRTASYSNLSILAEMSKGWKIADMVAILGSVDIVLGDVDR